MVRLGAKNICLLRQAFAMLFEVKVGMCKTAEGKNLKNMNLWRIFTNSCRRVLYIMESSSYYSA
ncbi:MAG: hypothetical protein H6Q75_1702 [Firmicutes bacterium]|nr:hypothetical protein [Bacillota bacterium]